MDDETNREGEDRLADLPDVEEDEASGPRPLLLSRELRGWIAGLSAVAIAVAALGLPGGVGLTASLAGLGDDSDAACRPGGPNGITNIPDRIATSVCVMTADPKALFAPALQLHAADGAAVTYSTSFTVGFDIGIASSALLPVVIDDTTITASISGTGEFTDACARVEADAEVTQGGAPLDASSDLTVLFPLYYVTSPLGGSGALQSRMAIEISGVGPSGADLGTWPIIDCLVTVTVPYSQGVVPGVFDATAGLTSYPPADLVLGIANCTGTEGNAECLGLVSDLVDGASVTIAGPWDAIRVTPMMTYTWTDGSKVDEDKAYVSLNPGGKMRADFGSSSYKAPAVVHGADVTTQYCGSLEVRDVDQWWDANGNQHLDTDSFCLMVTYVRVAVEARDLGSCASDTFSAPSSNWHGTGALQCVLALEGVTIPVVPGGAKALQVVQEAADQFSVVPQK